MYCKLLVCMVILMPISLAMGVRMPSTNKNCPGCVPTKVEVVAHRGFSYIAPENTKAAYMLAWEVGCPAAECDVYLTKDNKIMLMHDKSAKRTSGVDVNMADTNSAELRKLDVGSWKDPDKYKGEKIPYLDEILETIPEGRTFFIEIKSGPEILPYLKQVIDKSNKRNQLVIIDFDFETIVACKKLMPDIPAYWLIWTKKDKKTEQPIAHSLKNIDKVKSAGLDGIDAHYAGVNKAFTDKIHEAGLKLYTWTVDDPNEAKRLEGLGVTGITSNRPNLLFDCLKR